jgi:hypothetical protein
MNGNKEMVVSKAISQSGKVEFSEIYVRSENSEWCRILWREEGWVIILSDYGHWAYWWGYRGEGVSVPQFLSNLDRDYMGRKMLGADLMVFSLEETVKAIRAELACADDDSYEHELDLVEQLESGKISPGEWYEDTFMPDPYELSRTEICSSWSSFWDRIWVPLVQPMLRAECEKENQSTTKDK